MFVELDRLDNITSFSTELEGLHVLAFDGLDGAVMGEEYHKSAVCWGLVRGKL